VWILSPALNKPASSHAKRKHHVHDCAPFVMEQHRLKATAQEKTRFDQAHESEICAIDV